MEAIGSLITSLVNFGLSWINCSVGQVCVSSNTHHLPPLPSPKEFLGTANMGRRKRNNKSTSSSVELARASIDAAAQPLQPTEQSGQQDTPQTQLPKALLQEDAVADQAAKKTQQIKARLSQLLKEQQQGKETLVKLNAELQVGRLCADVVLQ